MIPQISKPYWDTCTETKLPKLAFEDPDQLYKFYSESTGDIFDKVQIAGRFQDGSGYVYASIRFNYNGRYHRF